MVKKLLILILFLTVSSILFSISTRNSHASTFLSRNTPSGLLDFGSYCTISWTDPAPASQSCKTPYICRLGQTAAAQCLEVPTSGSLPDGSNCLADDWCQSKYCEFTAGYTGVSTCKTKCSTATCSGTCFVQTTTKVYPPGYPADVNQCIPSDPCTTTANKPLSCSCQNSSECESGYCGASQGESYTCQRPLTSTPTPTQNANTGSSCTVEFFPTTQCSTYNGVSGYLEANYVCPDGTSGSIGSQQGACESRETMYQKAVTLCANHMTCINQPTPAPTFVPSPTPTPVWDPFCRYLNFNCPPQDTITPQPSPTPSIFCDPNGDGTINMLDFQWWKDEFIKIRPTTISDCFKPDRVVDLLDFQVWKNKFLFSGTDAPQPIQ